MNNDPDTKIQEMMQLIKEYFQEWDFYLELIAQKESELKDIKKINTALHELAKNTDTPYICNTNFHYINEDDSKAFEVGLSIKDGKRIYDEDRRKVVGDRYIMSEDEVLQTMKINGYNETDIKYMLHNTENIVANIDLQLPLGTILFPKYESQDAIKEKYEQIKDQLIEKQ